MQVRSLVDVPGEKLPSAATGALQDYLRSQVAPQVLTSRLFPPARLLHSPKQKDALLQT